MPALPIDDIHADILRAIGHLIDLDPAPDTPEFVLLRDLAALVDAYEKVRYPFPLPPKAP